jgi:hypothetical protein
VEERVWNRGCVSQTFCLCDKIPDISNLRVGEMYFSSWLQRFQSIVLGSIDSGPMLRQNNMAAAACGRRWGGRGKKEREREREREKERKEGRKRGRKEGAGDKIPPRTYPSDLLSPARPHLPTS